MIEKFFTFPVFNTVTPSSAGAIAAPTLGLPASNETVNTLFPADATVELVNDVEWIMAMGSR